MMKTTSRYAAAVAAAGALASGTAAVAQMPSPPPRAIVSLYHAAPGQQEALVRWLAQQDHVAASAGVGRLQLYVHTDGDSWDYMTISPVTTDAQDQAIEAAAKKMGVATGPRLPLELRKYISSHTDTYTIGPITAEQYLVNLDASACYGTAPVKLGRWGRVIRKCPVETAPNGRFGCKADTSLVNGAPSFWMRLVASGLISTLFSTVCDDPRHLPARNSKGFRR